MPKSTKTSNDWGGNMQNAVAEMSKQKQSIYVHTEFQDQLRKVHRNTCSRDHAENLKKVILQKSLTMLTIIIS